MAKESNERMEKEFQIFDPHFLAITTWLMSEGIQYMFPFVAEALWLKLRFSWEIEAMDDANDCDWEALEPPGEPYLEVLIREYNSDAWKYINGDNYGKSQNCG